MALAICPPAAAGALAVTPLRLTFTGGAITGAITVENPGKEAILVQTEVLTWEQDGAEERLSPTEELIAVPPIFTLAPGGKQILRVGLLRSFVEPRERTFRLLVAEVPTATTPNAIAVAVQHSLPIFVLPRAAVFPRLVARRGHASSLDLANTGSAHLRMHRWRLYDGNGTLLAEAAGPGYLLAGARRTLPLGGRAFAEAAVLEADLDGGATQKFPVEP